MKQEITIEVLCDKERCFKILEENGFEVRRQFEMDDYYYTHNVLGEGIEYKQLIDSSILVRVCSDDKKNVGQLLYKKKAFNRNNEVIGETKIRSQVLDVESVIKAFNLAGFKNWCIKKALLCVFVKDNREIIVQDVENFGLYIEIEQSECSEHKQKSTIKQLIKFAKSLNLPLGDDYFVRIPFEIFKRS